MKHGIEEVEWVIFLVSFFCVCLVEFRYIKEKAILFYFSIDQPLILFRTSSVYTIFMEHMLTHRKD